ncbi:DUF4339 domain-containing protein [uncultured Rhodoblastus sp.]|uniref:DUF4339 domain-containing protein n=1 Tax=uncultured Rhodoblastus sp. TaxID=543037 RepID=UPI0025D08BBF|nr:DUF4339 domain-containing protein [uncultured Rhodoblastus sp.]
MAGNYFFKDRAGAQNGPVSLDELAALARAGRLGPADAVWVEGGGPAPASEVPELAAALGEAGNRAAAGVGPLQSFLPVWGLFWRSIVASLGISLVFTAPWAGLWFYRWFAGRVALPNGVRLFLQGDIGQCWPTFVGFGLIGLGLGLVNQSPTGQAIAGALLLINAGLVFALTGWFARALRSEDGALKVSFEGGFWTFFGWSVLFLFAVETIVGWAWILKLMLRWICAQTVGTHEFEFTGTGVSILWRTFAAALGCVFILPIPWMIRWLAGWFISRIVVTPPAASAANILQAQAA